MRRTHVLNHGYKVYFDVKLAGRIYARENFYVFRFISLHKQDMF